jgi:hypothetical protein
MQQAAQQATYDAILQLPADERASPAYNPG